MPEGMPWDDLIGADAGWRRLRLADVLREVDVRAGDSEQALPVLSLTKNLGLIPQEERFAHRVARADVSDYKVVRSGWLVYNPYVIWEGAIHVLRSESAGLVSPVYATWEVAEADPEFIDCVVKTTTVLARFSQLSSGVVQRRRSIRKNGFLSVEIALPEESVQQKISLLLRQVQGARDACDRVIAAGQDLKTSIVRHLLKYGCSRLDDISELDLRDSTVDPIPASWSEVSLGEVAELVQYGTSERCELALNGGTPVLRIPNIQDGRIDTTEIKYLSTPKTDDRLELRGGDLLFVRTNAKREHTGRCAVFQNELPRALFASYLIRIRFRPHTLLPEFVQLVASTAAGRRQLAGRASRAADGKFNINSQTIKTTRVPMPPIETQAAIVRIVRAIDRKTDLVRQRREALQSLKHSLIETLVDRLQQSVDTQRNPSG